MVYECLQCQAPQAVGAVVCPHCGAEFAGAVPEDATMPEETVQEAQPLDAEAPPPLYAQPAPPLPDPLQQTAVPPSSQWAMPVPSYIPNTQLLPSRSGPNKMWLLGGIPLALIVVGVFAYIVFNAEQPPPVPPQQPIGVTAVPYVPTAPTVSPTAPAVAPSAPNSASTGTGSLASQPAPVGRWMSKDFTYYEFDQGGTGTEGSANNSKPAQSFSWTVLKNDLILSSPSGASSAVQHLPFSYGPDQSTLYLRQPNGRYMHLSKVGS